MYVEDMFVLAKRKFFYSFEYSPVWLYHIFHLSRPYWLEKAMVPHSSTLAWKIPWTEEPGGLQSMGSRRVGYNWATSLTFHSHALEKEMAAHSSVLAWRIPGMGEPGGLPSVGSYRVGHNWSDLAAAAADPIDGHLHWCFPTINNAVRNKSFFTVNV